MSKMRGLLIAGLLAGAALLGATSAQAGGRTISGGHPYHNGYLFVPPSSAYEAVRYRPPMRYGVPSYYYPASYLPAAYVTPFPPMPYVIHRKTFGYYYFADQPIGYFYAW